MFKRLETYHLDASHTYAVFFKFQIESGVSYSTYKNTAQWVMQLSN